MQNQINSNQNSKKNNTQKRVGQLNKSSGNPFENNKNKESNQFKNGGNFVPASMQHNKNDMKDSQRGLSQIFNSNSSLKQLSQLFNLSNLRKDQDKKMF